MDFTTLMNELDSTRVKIAQRERELIGLEARARVLQEMLEEQSARVQFPRASQGSCLDAALRRQQEAGARGRPGSRSDRLPSGSAAQRPPQTIAGVDPYVFAEEDARAWQEHSENASRARAARIMEEEASEAAVAALVAEDDRLLSSRALAERLAAEDTASQDLIDALVENERELSRVARTRP